MKQTSISSMKKILFFILLVLIFLLINVATVVSKNKMKEKQAFEDTQQIYNVEDAFLEIARERHNNNTNYNFDIEEVEKNAEKDIDKAMIDITSEVRTLSDCLDYYSWSKKYDIDAVYSVDNYKGELAINVSKLPDIDITGKTKVLVGPNNVDGNIKECKYKLNDDILTVDCEKLEPVNSYIVAIGEKKKVSFDLGAIVDKGGKLYEVPSTEDGNFLVSFYFFPRLLHNKKPALLMVSSGDEERDEALKEMCLESAIDSTDADLKGTMHMDLRKEDIEIVTPERFALEYIKLKTLFPNSEKRPYAVVQPKKKLSKYYKQLYFMRYYTYSDLENMIDISDYYPEYEEHEEALFGLEDVLRLKNFVSKYSIGGNCAGFSYYAMKLFNSGSFPSSGEMDFSVLEGKFTETNELVKWDLAIDDKNDCLTEKGKVSNWNIGKYLNAMNDEGEIIKYDIAGNPEPYEEEVIKMLGSYWLQTNMNLYVESGIDLVKDPGDCWDYALVQDVKNVLDDNKIAYLGICYETKDKDKVSHAVVAYDYLDVSDNQTLIFVYDCNYPEKIPTRQQRKHFKNRDEYIRRDTELTEEQKINSLLNGKKDLCIISIHKKELNGKECFYYDYPIMYKNVDPSQIYDGAQMSNRFTVCDENYNIFNVKYQQ